ncbi:hypothetical protein DSUL_120010 [Desulfovibrionales bacterium]
MGSTIADITCIWLPNVQQPSVSIDLTASGCLPSLSALCSYL